MHRRKLEESEIERSTEIMPVQHIVMFTLQDDVAEDKVAALKKGLLDLPEKLGLEA
jgi:Stress responsive A/B Barrel Domain